MAGDAGLGGQCGVGSMMATALPFLAAEDVAGRCHNPQPTKLGWSVSCPAKDHPDTNNLATVAMGKNGNTVMHCFRGCTVEEMCEGLGIEVSQLMAPRNGRPSTPSANGHHKANGKAAKPSARPTANLPDDESYLEN